MGHVRIATESGTGNRAWEIPVLRDQRRSVTGIGRDRRKVQISVVGCMER